MIAAHDVAAHMAREASRRRLTDSPREPRPHRHRRLVASLLHAAAYRLDARTHHEPVRAMVQATWEGSRK
jgi:hypothetical protein